MRTRYQPGGDESRLPLLADNQPPRKKIRKGTRSCWECKHRKVRCNFASDADSSCKECISRGTVCRSQDLPEPENYRESDRSNLNERMGRMEGLLEKILHKLDAFENTTSFEQHSTVRRSPEPATPANDNAPVLSLFQNELLGSQPGHTTGLRPNLLASTGRDMAKVRHDLMDLMLPDRTINQISGASSCWWLLRTRCFNDYDNALLPIPFSDLPTSHPATIAKCLLWIGISLQQLPTWFDISSLKLPCCPKQLIDRYIKITSDSAIFDEAMLSNLDGIECLILQAIIHNNDGRLRSSWISYRKALNVAQIIGLHSPIPAGCETLEVVTRVNTIWNHLIYADRYLSLMLGMFHGIGDVALKSHEEKTKETWNPHPMSILCQAAGSIIERNQTFSDITPAMVNITQTIDARIVAIELDLVDVESPKDVSGGKTIERADSYSRLMTNLWFYQLTAWLHLPFLLKSTTPGRYEYSKNSCLQASREMISCYTKIRKLTEESFCCKSLDFQAFTAAVTLVLNMLGPGEIHQFDPNDWVVIDTVIDILRQQNGGDGSDKVATRGLAALETLKGIATNNHPVRNNSSETATSQGDQENVKIDIPYFGTFLLHRKISSPHHAEQQPSLVSELSTYRNTSNIAQHVPEERTIRKSMNPMDSNNMGLIPNEDIWTFDIDLTTLPPFLSDFGDDWDLGL